jgi:RimJ/RimL family protein N-acetyltransferase
LQLERWAVRHEPAALAYLERAPYDNVFLSYLIRTDPSALARGALHLVFEGLDLRGVGFFGRQVVLAADDAAIPLLAKCGQRTGERMIVGPRAQVLHYWELVAAHHQQPRRVRNRQLVMAVDPSSLRGEDPHTVVRQARPDEWEIVAENSAQMIATELEYDPRTQPGDFAGGVRQMIERGLWWVGEYEGELCFFCNVGPWSPHTAQLQGIWMPPRYRGRGLGTRALAAICRRLFTVVPTLSLYVNDFNGEAVRLYERTGFTRVGEFATLLF